MMGTQNSKSPGEKLYFAKFTCQYSIGTETENCSSVKEYCYRLRDLTLITTVVTTLDIKNVC